MVSLLLSAICCFFSFFFFFSCAAASWLKEKHVSKMAALNYSVLWLARLVLEFKRVGRAAKAKTRGSLCTPPDNPGRHRLTDRTMMKHVCMIKIGLGVQL